MAKHKQSARGTDVWTKIAERTKVVPDRPEDGPLGACWLWTGALSSDGYAIVSPPNGKGSVRVSGIVLEKTLGRHRGAGECALHTCDNPVCVRASHLFAGTRSDNVADMVAKGRSSCGDKHSCAVKATTPRGEDRVSSKLTNDQVVEICFATGSQHAIAKRYGIAQTQVSRIKTGKRWGHITQPLRETPPQPQPLGTTSVLS